MLTFSADEIFKIGMEVELNGKVFYNTAAQLCRDPDAKAVMEYLRDEEQRHYDSFAQMRKSLPEGARSESVFDPNGEMALYLKALADSRIFITETQASGLAKNCADAAAVFQVALRFEKDSVLMFQTMKEGTKPEWGQDKIDFLIAAEQEHVRRISAALAKVLGKA